jgi:hypothetical protein
MSLTTDRLRELRAAFSGDTALPYRTAQDLCAVIDELIAAREAAVATDAEVEAAIDDLSNIQSDIAQKGFTPDRSNARTVARAKLRSLFRRQPAPQTLDEGSIASLRRFFQQDANGDIDETVKVAFPAGRAMSVIKALREEVAELKAQQPAPDPLPGGIIEYVPTEADKSLLAAAEAVANDAGQVHERHCGFSYRYHEVGTESIKALRAAVESARKETK